MKIESLKSINFSGKVRNKKVASGKSSECSPLEPACNKKDFEIGRLRAILLGLTAVGGSLLAATCWFKFTKGDIKIKRHRN